MNPGLPSSQQAPQHGQHPAAPGAYNTQPMQSYPGQQPGSHPNTMGMSGEQSIIPNKPDHHIPKLQQVTYFLAFPDPQTSNYLETLIRSMDPSAQYVHLESYTELYTAVHGCMTRTVILSEWAWNGQDVGQNLLVVLNMLYGSAIGIITEYDPSQTFPPLFPIPYVVGMNNMQEVQNLVRSLSEDLRDQQLGAYQVQEFAGQSSMGRLYKAHQPSIRRDVYLTVSWFHFSVQQIEEVKQYASALARNVHPSVYALYESFESNHRQVISNEPLEAVSIYQAEMLQGKLDARTVARLINTMSLVIKHMQTQMIPHVGISSRHVTISQSGTIKVQNIAHTNTMTVPSEPEQVKRIINIVMPVLINPNNTYPRLQNMLAYMDQGQFGLDKVLEESQAIDVELAPVKYVPERQQKQRAMAEVQKARKSFYVYLMIGSIISAIMISAVAIKIIFQVSDIPGTDFREQVRIPAGIVKLPGKRTLELPEFYMDKHEVTIGQYEKFLEQVEGINPEDFLEQEINYTKRDFKPKSWDQIMDTIRYKRKYSGTYINRDTPVFNIDYYDALGYAKWAGKRLPTELEWQRAASGDESFRLPWGNKLTEKQNAGVNTGTDFKARPALKIDAGGIDGYIGPGEVNKFPLDKSPFGVLNMGGNVSEWCVFSPEFSKRKDNKEVYRGGNYLFPSVPFNWSREWASSHDSKPIIGIRCVSDKPVK